MRISNNLFGSKVRPRIAVFASNRYTYAQAIDDDAKVTLTSFSSLSLKKGKDYKKGKKTDEAKQVGVELAKLIKDLKIAEAIFDRSIYAYKGRVKALAEGLREGGLKI